MFKIVLVAALLGLAAAAANNLDKNAEVRSLKNVPADVAGNYAYAFDTTNGIAIQESGSPAGVSGSAKWTSPENIPIELKYVANENGYQPSGAHLPVSPPIPEAIIRALEYIRTHPPKDQKVVAPFKG